MANSNERKINTKDWTPLSEALQNVADFPDTRFCLSSPPGAGKTASVRAITEKLRTPNGTPYRFLSVDCSQAEIGDQALPDIATVKVSSRMKEGEVERTIEKAIRVCQFVPSTRYIGEPTEDGELAPVWIFLDELTKAGPNVIGSLCRLINEGYVGDTKLPPGSRLTCAGNLSSDAIGDSFPAHAFNRLTQLNVDYPTPKEWISTFAQPAGLHPILLHFAAETKTGFGLFDNYAKFDTDPTNPWRNPFVFHPSLGQTRHFTSPRSLTACDQFVRMWMSSPNVSDTRLHRLLAGTIGIPAAEFFVESTLTHGRNMPKLADLRAEPGKVKQAVRDYPGFATLQVTSILDELSREHPDFASMNKENRAPIQAQCAKDLEALGVIAMESTDRSPELTQVLVRAVLATTVGPVPVSRQMAPEFDKTVNAVLAARGARPNASRASF